MKRAEESINSKQSKKEGLHYIGTYYDNRFGNIQIWDAGRDADKKVERDQKPAEIKPCD